MQKAFLKFVIIFKLTYACYMLYFSVKIFPATIVDLLQLHVSMF